MTAPHQRGRVSEANNPTGIVILNFTPRSNKHCATCGVPFQPVHQWHELCRQCWTFKRLALACARFNRRAAL